MTHRLIWILTFCGMVSGSAVAKEPATPWRQDKSFQRLAAVLDKVPAIDMHSHILEPGEFDPEAALRGPLMLRASHPWLPATVRARFGVTVNPADWKATHDAIVAARAAMIERLGEHEYWMNHLDYTLTDIAFVNQSGRENIDDQRLRWVPYATTLLFPLPADHLKERSPAHEYDVAYAEAELAGLLQEAGLSGAPGDLTAYVAFVDAVLRRWQEQGAVAVKFYDAYLRTLHIADVPEEQAAALYQRGRTVPLGRDDYIALQDYLWRHILLEAGRINMIVHIHSSFGEPPFLRTQESDVRNLEDVLADPAFFDTKIVLIHAGGPWYETASYLAAKPNVWVDISSMAFMYTVPDLAAILRKCLVSEPEKLLYGTDAAAYPSVPGGAEVQHIILARATRDALYVALAGLIRDGVVDEERALEMGRGVLRDNARRLQGWE